MKKVLIITSNYYPEISKELTKSAEFFFLKKKYIIKKLYAPGAFEIPLIIAKNIKFFDGFVALGCIIKGETPHFDFISQSINYGFVKLSIENKKPIGNGVLTCLSKLQATKRVIKGKEAAMVVDFILKNDVTK